VRLTDFDDVASGASAQVITAPGGTPWAASDFVVNCPIIAEL
jgi:hypothetical protein